MRRASWSWGRGHPRRLWEARRWSGRACKICARVGDALLITMQTGLLDY